MPLIRTLVQTIEIANTPQKNMNIDAPVKDVGSSDQKNENTSLRLQLREELLQSATGNNGFKGRRRTFWS